MSTIDYDAVKSVRATTDLTFAVPHGFTLDEWRGGNCAAAVTEHTDDDGTVWEVGVHDGGLRIPTPDDIAEEGATVELFVSRFDEEADGYYEAGEHEVPVDVAYDADRRAALVADLLSRVELV